MTPAYSERANLRLRDFRSGTNPANQPLDDQLMNRNPVNGSESGIKGRGFAGKKGDDTGQKDKTGKKGGKGGAVLGEINDDPKKKKPK